MASSGTFNFSPASDTTLALGSFSSSGIVAFGGSSHITLSGGALSLGSVEIANTHAAGITPVSNWTLAGDVLIDSGATFHAGSFTHKIAGNVSNQGTLDRSSSDISSAPHAQRPLSKRDIASASGFWHSGYWAHLPGQAGPSCVRSSKTRE